MFSENSSELNVRLLKSCNWLSSLPSSIIFQVTKNILSEPIKREEKIQKLLLTGISIYFRNIGTENKFERRANFYKECIPLKVSSILLFSFVLYNCRYGCSM